MTVAETTTPDEGTLKPDPLCVNGEVLSGVVLQPIDEDRERAKVHFWPACLSTFFCHLLGLAFTLLFFNSHQGKVGATTGLAMAALKVSICAAIGAVLVAHSMPHGIDYSIGHVHSEEICHAVDGRWMERHEGHHHHDGHHGGHHDGHHMGHHDGNHFHHEHHQMNRSMPAAPPRMEERDAEVQSRSHHHKNHKNHHGNKHHFRHNRTHPHHAQHNNKHKRTWFTAEFSKNASELDLSFSAGVGVNAAVEVAPEEHQNRHGAHHWGHHGEHHGAHHWGKHHKKHAMRRLHRHHEMWLAQEGAHAPQDHYCECPRFAHRVVHEGEVICKSSIVCFIAASIMFIVIFATLLGVRCFLIAQERKRRAQPAYVAL